MKIFFKVFFFVLLISYHLSSKEIIDTDFTQLNIDIDTIFNSEIINNFYDLNYNSNFKAETFNDIINFNNSFFINLNDFYNIKNKIYIEDMKFKQNYVTLNYTISDKDYEAYAYHIEIPKNKDSKKCLLVIPGSGLNQSTEIINRNEINYHYGIIDSFDDFKKYIYIKPNEDIYALVGSNNKKLSYDFITNFHLLNGGSYSASYISQILAFLIHFDNICQKVVIMGISQGGEAALIASLMHEPDFSIIISGIYINYDLSWKSFKQIDIPNLINFYTDKISKSSNNKNYFYFIWGEKENLFYSNEAKN